MSSRVPILLLMVLALVAACSSDGDGDISTVPSSIPQFTTDPPVEVVGIPNPPTGLIVVDTRDGAIELAWDASRSAEVIGYRVIRTGTTGTVEFDAAEAAFTDDGLENGAVFTYAVLALTSGAESDRSAPVSAQVGEDTNPPSVPGRPVVADRDSSVALDWRASRDASGVDAYVVVRTIDGVSEEITVTEPTLDDDVAAGTVATYAVYAIDGNGNRSEPGRPLTVLAGSSTDRVIVVVSAQADADDDLATSRLHKMLLVSGYSVTWFEDDAFDANITRPGELVLLLGDVAGQGFDWNIFATDSTVIGLKSMFVQASGLTADPPKLDRLSQLDYASDGGAPVEVMLTTTGRPKPVVYIPAEEQPTHLEVWGTPVWSTELAVAGLVPAGGELATEAEALGCRAFFPGNTDSLSEQTDAGWELLLRFIADVEERCKGV